MKNINEVLVEIRDYIQACREAGENDLRGIIHFVDSKIIECNNLYENEEDY